MIHFKVPAFIITKASVGEEKPFSATLLVSMAGACEVYYLNVVMGYSILIAD